MKRSYGGVFLWQKTIGERGAVAKEKTYRPKAGVENLSLDVMMPDTATGGQTFHVSSDKWPYTTEDPVEQAALDAHPLVTDRAESAKSSGAKGDS